MGIFVSTIITHLVDHIKKSITSYPKYMEIQQKLQQTYISGYAKNSERTANLQKTLVCV